MNDAGGLRGYCRSYWVSLTTTYVFHAVAIAAAAIVNTVLYAVHPWASALERHHLLTSQASHDLWLPVLRQTGFLDPISVTAGEILRLPRICESKNRETTRSVDVHFPPRLKADAVLASLDVKLGRQSFYNYWNSSKTDHKHLPKQEERRMLVAA